MFNNTRIEKLEKKIEYLERVIDNMPRFPSDSERWELYKQFATHKSISELAEALNLEWFNEPAKSGYRPKSNG